MEGRCEGCVVGSFLDLLESTGRKANINVVELATWVLSAYPNELARSIAFEYFSKKGLRFLLGQRVKALERDKVMLANKNFVQAAGIRSSNLNFITALSRWTKGFLLKVEKMHSL
jgi:NADH dehydrogenase FAD-containing subunit